MFLIKVEPEREAILFWLYILRRVIGNIVDQFLFIIFRKVVIFVRDTCELCSLRYHWPCRLRSLCDTISGRNVGALRINRIEISSVTSAASSCSLRSAVHLGIAPLDPAEAVNAVPWVLASYPSYLTGNLTTWVVRIFFLSLSNNYKTQRRGIRYKHSYSYL